MLNTIAMVALGGAFGAVSRYGFNILGYKIAGDSFPLATLSVNVIGSFLMGLVIALMAHIWQPPAELRVFIVTGFLGAFTTFSTFSLDFAALWERNAYTLAGLYLGASVVLSIAALFAAMALVRAVYS